tara:strand:+ start:1779 stop:2048 length:270 start_codon:yes stop_codon:yes gene_type:complete
MKKTDLSYLSDEEIENRLNGIKIMLDENIDVLGKNLGIKISDKIRKSIIDVIGKTTQMLEYNWENCIRQLERSYQKLPEKMKNEIESGN